MSFSRGDPAGSFLVRASSRLGLTVGVFLFGCAATAPVNKLTTPLGHPTVAERLKKVDISEGYRFAVFGDQKNHWGKEFSALLRRVRQMADSTREPPLLFMMDSGDIVAEGHDGTQFDQLRGHLSIVKDLPYEAGVGNHETQPEGKSIIARQNTATFLRLNPEKLYYKRTIGKARFLFLDTNDFPSLYPALPDRTPAEKLARTQRGARGKAQLEWLAKELETPHHPTIVVSHHAFFQSAGRHQDHAYTLWTTVYRELGVKKGKTLPVALIEGGVDLVITGHVHSYEVFKLKRGDHSMWTLNTSGTPGAWYRTLWDWARRKGTRWPKNWDSEKKMEKFDLSDDWEARQLTYMTKSTKVDQFAVITVGKAGRLDIELMSVGGDVLYRMQIPQGVVINQLSGIID